MSNVAVIDEASPDVDFEEERIPQIVKTKRFHLGPLTPDEAVEKMENMDHGFFFFINKETARSSVVYSSRRRRCRPDRRSRIAPAALVLSHLWD